MSGNANTATVAPLANLDPDRWVEFQVGKGSVKLHTAEDGRIFVFAGGTPVKYFPGRNRELAKAEGPYGPYAIPRSEFEIVGGQVKPLPSALKRRKEELILLGATHEGPLRGGAFLAHANEQRRLAAAARKGAQSPLATLGTPPATTPTATPPTLGATQTATLTETPTATTTAQQRLRRIAAAILDRDSSALAAERPIRAEAEVIRAATAALKAEREAEAEAAAARAAEEADNAAFAAELLAEADEATLDDFIVEAEAEGEADADAEADAEANADADADDDDLAVGGIG